MASIEERRKASKKWKGVWYDAGGDMTDCFFCGLCASKEKDRVVYDDGVIAVVTPLRKDSELHLMVCPIGHVNDTRDLGVEEAPLLRHMEAVAEHCVTFARKRRDAGEPLSIEAGDTIPPMKAKYSKGFSEIALASLATQVAFADIEGSTLTFHTAPLFNSLDHLHLHILDGEWRDWYQKFRHTTWPMSVYVDDVIDYVTSEEDTNEMPSYRNHWLQTVFPTEQTLATLAKGGAPGGAASPAATRSSTRGSK